MFSEWSKVIEPELEFGSLVDSQAGLPPRSRFSGALCAAPYLPRLLPAHLGKAESRLCL